MPTNRNFAKEAFQCGLYEAQDVLVDIDDVDLMELDPGWRFRARDNLHRKLLFRDLTGMVGRLNPGLRKVRLSREYDLFVGVCQNYWDLIYLNAIQGWKDYCKTTVCLVDELWIADLPDCQHWIDILCQFDHVFLGYEGTASILSHAIRKECRWLPGAVDTIRFCPYPSPPARVVDVYSMGRKWDGVHNALLQASSHEHLYLFDSCAGMAKMEPYSHRQHRELLATLAKRCTFFTVAPGKMDRRDETKDQVEIGLRYYEGSAAGTVMIGQAPDTEAFRRQFPWQDVIIEIEPDGSDVLQLLARLRSEPDRVAEIGRRNAMEALLRHDWVYRWKEVLHVAGLDPAPAMAARERRLLELAGIAAEPDRERNVSRQLI